jgi:hypothetical protein
MSLGASAKLWAATINSVKKSVCFLSVRPSTWNDTAPTGRIFIKFDMSICWPGGSVGVANELRAGRSGDRIPVGARFSSVQTDPGANPASCTMGTGSFPGVESGRGVTLTPQPLLVPRSKNRVELYLYSP